MCEYVYKDVCVCVCVCVCLYICVCLNASDVCTVHMGFTD